MVFLPNDLCASSKLIGALEVTLLIRSISSWLGYFLSVKHENGNDRLIADKIELCCHYYGVKLEVILFIGEINKKKWLWGWHIPKCKYFKWSVLIYFYKYLIVLKVDILKFIVTIVCQDNKNVLKPKVSIKKQILFTVTILLKLIQLNMLLVDGIDNNAGKSPEKVESRVLTYSQIWKGGLTLENTNM